MQKTRVEGVGMEVYEELARLFSILSHPRRVQILDLLRRGEACVCHIQAALGLPQPYISQQLRVMRDAGVISSRREGLFTYYSLTDERVKHFLEETLGPAEGLAAIGECPCPKCRELRGA